MTDARDCMHTSVDSATTVLGRVRRGVALVIVLWTVALLATATAIASSAARSSAQLAMNVRAQSIARSMAESGVLAARVAINDSLRALVSNVAQRDAYLLGLEPRGANPAPFIQDTLGDGVFAVTVVDVSARLDINNAGIEGLTTLFSTATSGPNARAMAERIEAMVRGDAIANSAFDETQRQRDSLEAALLGRDRGTRFRRPFESLDALTDVAGVDAAVIGRVAEFLTVDGDGRINRQSAPREVLASATGSLVDAPSRILIIARGWQRGHPLTRQVEAVYDIADDGLRLVRWREHDR